MKTREYVSCICKINEMLVTFLTADQESKLPNDEMYTVDEFCTMKKSAMRMKGSVNLNGEEVCGDVIYFFM